jgi:hypothetical protein
MPGVCLEPVEEAAAPMNFRLSKGLKMVNLVIGLQFKVLVQPEMLQPAQTLSGMYLKIIQITVLTMHRWIGDLALIPG